MMTQSRVSLSWDAYERNICNGLGLLQQRGEFVDMTLAADGYHVKVHQIVLSLVSPYIKDLIRAAECPHPVIFLNKVSYDTLQSILEYAYTGEAVVDPERLDCFLQACRELHITGLQDVTTKSENNESVTHEDPPNRIHEIYLASPLQSPRKRRRTIKAEESLENAELTDEAHDDIHGSDDEQFDDDIADTTYQPDEEEETQETSIRETKMNIEYLDHENDDYEEIEPYRQGSRWVCRDEHYYVAHRAKGNSVYFRCSSVNCPVRWKLSMTMGAAPVVGEHNHAPTPWIRSRNAMFQMLKKRSTHETIPLNVIYEQEAARYQDAIPHLSYENVAPSMRKWRQAAKKALSRSLQSTG